MRWVVLAIVLLGVLYAGWAELRRARRLRRFWERPGTAARWAREFPAATGEQVREFLEMFVDAFAFSRKRTFCFAPEDTLDDVYRTVYPKLGGGDMLETECLYRLLERRYRVSLEPVWQPAVTLGGLFRHVYGSGGAPVTEPTQERGGKTP